jgi:hypothetical protein
LTFGVALPLAELVKLLPARVCRRRKYPHREFKEKGRELIARPPFPPKKPRVAFGKQLKSERDIATLQQRSLSVSRGKTHLAAARIA